MIKLSKFAPFTDGFYDTGDQVHGWVMSSAKKHFYSEKRRKERLSTVEDVRYYQQGKRRLFMESIGGLPAERTPLKTIETGSLARDGYTIRKLIYQSMPSMYVTGNLYLPDGIKKPVPGVLMGCGHTREGKAAPVYQKVAIDLVRAGFPVFIIDSPSHGEMLQCVDPETGEPAAGLTTREHSHLQLSASVTGHNVMRYFLWNAIRGMDLLCERPEVNPERVGVTGNSGGGHLTQALMMAEPRLAAAMSCCSQSTRESYMDTGVRAYDGEQNFFGCVSSGLDYDDFLSSIAPRPVRIGAAEYDYFAIEGVIEAYERVSSIYRIYGAEGNVDLCIAQGERHAYSAPLRRGCVEWFARHLQGRSLKPALAEPETEPPELLQCTQTGQVMNEFSDARSIIDLNHDHWLKTREAQIPKEIMAGRQWLRKQLGIPHKCEKLRLRRTRTVQQETYTSENVFFFSEPGIIVTAVLYKPHGALSGAALLLIPDGTEGQEPYKEEIKRLLESKKMVMVFDVRGTGAVRMRKRNRAEGYAIKSTEFRVANDHFMLGTSLAAKRAFDVLRAIEFLRVEAGSDQGIPIELSAHGAPAIWGLLAAASKGDLDACSFSGIPDSWETAFSYRPPERNSVSEPLIVPELSGEADIDDLMKLALQ